MFDPLRRELGAFLAVLLAAIIGLIAVTTFRPEWFTFVVGAVGASGALHVVYEVHHTKRIAQAGFVRDL
ncbi:MAG: hypothetical protein RLZZ01_329, partial [Actinomycetota bacterium]